MMSEELPGVGLVRAGSVLTGGAYELFEARVDARQGPPEHVHRERDEGFYVLGGEFSVWCDGAGRRVSPGSFAFVPRGARHRFEACSDGARLLFIVSPAGLEGFFRELASLVGGGVPEPEARRRLSERYHSHPLPGGSAPAGPGERA